ncbi:hypothetical protein ACGFWI_37905 [Streptomyces sp. NPDC048434]|uniref:hypothetical protein n=1 Tax=Streptomyces sp. NPDC048434 TaxID=3365549 RepID=UPI0037122AA6
MTSEDKWQRWGLWQKYGARGVKGPDALINEINRIVYMRGIKSPITTPRGLYARLKYLNSGPGRQALREQGITDRAWKNWMAGKSTPSPANRDRIDNAYWTRKRENMVRSGQLKKILNNDGRGRRMEIYPVDQSQVDESRRRPNVQQRSIQMRYIWDDLVDAWAAHDDATIDGIWDDVIGELDSDWGAYAYVSAVGIGA